MQSPPAGPRSSGSLRRRVPELHGLALLVALVLVASCAPVVGPSVADAQLLMRVKSVLLNDPRLGPQPIEVGVEGGVVELSGYVGSDDDRRRAIEIVRGVPGVRGVRSSLEVGAPPAPRPGPSTPGRSALATPDAPWRLLGLGVSGSRATPPDATLSRSGGLGPIVRLRPRNGWGPSIGFSWTSARIETGPRGDPALARLRLRPVMAGIEYGYARGRLAASASIVAGYSFNSLDVDHDQAGTYRAIATTGSLAVRPGVSFWYDVWSRVGLNGFAGYLFARPDVTFASDEAVEQRRLRADAVVLSVGVAYWIF